MKIIKFTKKQNGQYNMILEDETAILLHEDLILKYDLLLKKEILSKELEEILVQNDQYMAYNLAIKYLSIRMRSMREVKKYLLGKGIAEGSIEKTIKKLVEQKYLDDLKYAQSYTIDRINLSNDGPNKIAQFLKSQEISEEIIVEVLSVFSESEQKRKLKLIMDKAIRTNKNKGSHLLKQKLLFQVVSLGYDRDIASSLLENLSIPDKELREKEYEKLHAKLSKKYSGKELDYKIRQKLYQKGFSAE